MNAQVLATKNLTKRYQDKMAVDHVNLAVREGDIYGLIGRNGAGKTTFIRMVTALTSASGGELSLFGLHTPAELNRARKRMGSVVETPAFYPNLSAAQNLEYYRILRGIPEKDIVTRTLEMVGLSDAGNKKFKQYSLGMKQRLGIALALLGNPDFIILDEPINGLDPMGIVEMRDTFKKLNYEYGITLMISSHILTELSLIATRYGILNNGKLIKEFTREELKERCQKCLRLMVDNVVKAVNILESKLNTTKYKVINDNEIRLFDYLDTPSEVSYQLSANGVRVSGLNEIGDSLEDYFVWLIEEGNRNA